MDELDIEYYTKDDIIKTTEKVGGILKEDKNISNNKIAYILGGQPGAGKTTIHDMLQEIYDGNIISINADEYRMHHPHYKEIQNKYGKNSVDYTGKFSGEITEKLVDKLSSEGYNLIVEGTLRDKNVPLKTEKLLKEKGYRTELSVIVVKPEISYLSTKLRYEQMYSIGEDPRATPKENHDRVVDAIPDNLDEIYKTNKFDNITLYNRNQECLYEQHKTPELSPKEILENVFSSVWNTKELDDFKNDINEVISFMNKRNASPEEINNFKTEFQDIYKSKLVQTKKQLKNELRNPNNDLDIVKDCIKHVSSELKKLSPDEEKQKVKRGIKL